MTRHTAQRVTITLPPELVPFLERYQAQAQVSRSEAMVHGLRALQEKNLAEQYAELAQSRDPADKFLMEGHLDDFESGDGSEWL